MQVHNGIENVIFDFGGVVIDIDFNLTHKAFENLGVKNLDKLFSKAKQTELFDKFEKGILSDNEFRNEATKLLNINISEKEFDNAWNKMILDIPEKRIKLLQTIKSKYRTFLLSNSNKIHYALYYSELRTKHKIMCFEELFENVYFSFNTGMIKPDKDVFMFVIEQNNLNPEKTLFIDDSLQHIKAAEELGLQTYHLNNIDIVSLF